MTKKPFDVKAVNPRYGTAKMSEVARVVLRTKDPVARAGLEKLQAGAEDRHEGSASEASGP